MEEYGPNPSGKTIGEAVADGTLIDISEAAKREDFPYPAFISSALWEGVFNRSEKTLTEALQHLTEMYTRFWKFDHLGPTDWDLYTATLEVDDEIGRVLILTDFKAECDLGIKRVSGYHISRLG